MQATDDDSGINSVVTYSIVPDARGFSKKFKVNSITGWLSTLVSLDREKDPSIQLLVRATDSAKKFEDRRLVVCMYIYAFRNSRLSVAILL